MINTDNNKETENGVKPTDTAEMEVEAHILIRDLETQAVILNLRG